MLNQIDQLERSVYVLPTQRWVSTTISIPYAGPATRETHVSRPLVVNTSQALWLTNNFFAFYVNSTGKRVADVSQALVTMVPVPEVDNLLGDDELVSVYPDAQEGETANSSPVNPVTSTETIEAPVETIVASTEIIEPMTIETPTVSGTTSDEIPPAEILNPAETTAAEVTVKVETPVETPAEPTTTKKTAAKK